MNESDHGDSILMESKDGKRNRNIIVLTDGFANPVTAKTASCLLRYCSDEVLAVLDRQANVKTADQLLGVGGSIPVVGSIDEVSNAASLVIGIAPPGGKIPVQWRPIVLDAIGRGMSIYSGLHDYLIDDSEFVEAAKVSGAELVDVRRNDEREVASRQGIRDQCLRVHTVGQDCGVGKMLVAVELTKALNLKGRSTKFIATGQTGILVEGDGCPVDSVVSDFVSGSVEKMILSHQHHDILVVEGQGSLGHPRYSAVTLGLLHGCVPHALVLCYEAGRQAYNGLDHLPLPNLRHLRQVYETMASFSGPSVVVGVAMNSRLLRENEAEEERSRVQREIGLPVCDVIRHGPQDLVDAILEFDQARRAGRSDQDISNTGG